MDELKAKITVSVITTVELEENETIEQYKNRLADIYLHGASDSEVSEINKVDLGGDSKIEILPIDKPKFQVYMVWGSDTVGCYERFENGEELNDIQRDELRGNTSVYTFDTEAEKNAFMQGVLESQGWLDSRVLQETEMNKLIENNLY